MIPRNAVVFFGLLWFLRSAYGQIPPAPKSSDAGGKAPRIVAAERSKELGSVVHGDVVPLQWDLTNKGTADLVIERTVAGCGCTVVYMTDQEKVIPPGGSLALKAEFRSVGRKGEQIKSVVVHSNDPVEPQLELQFHARVEVLFEQNPPLRWVLRGTRRGQTASDTLDITPGENRKSIELMDARIKDPGLFLLKNEPLETPSGHGHRFRLTAADNAPLGHLTTAAVLRLKIGNVEKEVEVPINAEIVVDLTPQPKIVAPPSHESFPGMRLAPVVLRSLEKRPFDILEARAGNFLEVGIEPSMDKTPKTEYTLTMTIRPEAPAGPFGTTLEIRTDSPSQPVVRVPVFGMIAGPLDVDPPVIVLRQDGTVLGSERRVKVEALPKLVLDIASIKCEHPAVSVSMGAQEGSMGSHVRYLIVQLTGKLPPGTVKSKVTFTTNVPGAELVEVPVSIEVPG